METSILLSTKEILGPAAESDAFDHDILTHINSALSTLYQVGVGPATYLTVDSDQVVWEDLELPPEQLSMTKTYVFLKVQMLWDPPTTSYLITAKNEQIRELEVRLNIMREEAVIALEEVTEDDDE